MYSWGSHSSVWAWAKGALAWSRLTWWSQQHSTHLQQCFNSGAGGTRGCRNISYPGSRWREEKAFQLISKQYKSACQALLRDWLFKNLDQEPDDNDENEGGEDCISELQFYKRKNKV